MIKVEVELVAYYSVQRFTRKSFTAKAGCSAEDLFTQIGLDDIESAIIMVNGLHADKKTLLKDGDTIQFIPFVDGG